MRILLIEDDRLIGDGLNEGLNRLSFTVDWFKTGDEGYEALFQAPYDAVVLDLGLPDRNGLSILKEWRQKKRKEPVLILTAQGDVDQRVIGLDSGADDYLSKPFALAEVASFKNITYNPETKTVENNGKAVILAPKELMLLEVLLMNKNKVMTKETLENKLYSWDEDVQSNAVEVHVHHLRKKLGKDIVKTINKVGYILED